MSDKNVLYRFTGREAEVVYTPPPPPVHNPVPTSPTPTRPSPPRTPAIPTRPPVQLISGFGNAFMVPCSPGPSGERRAAIWGVDSAGNLISQISPCQ